MGTRELAQHPPPPLRVPARKIADADEQDRKKMEVFSILVYHLFINYFIGTFNY